MVVQWIQSSGYLAILLGMTLESACIPLPSEVIMPFGGYLAGAGHLQLWLVIVWGTVGNIIGSLIAYLVGRIGGRVVVLHYGKYVGLTERRLQAAERWFDRRGDWAVFIGRLLPGIRTFISLPAGVAKMPLGRFTAFTAIGSLPWVALLAYAGYKLGQNWESAKQYTHPLMYVAVVLVIGAIAWGVVRLRQRQRARGR